MLEKAVLAPDGPDGPHDQVGKRWGGGGGGSSSRIVTVPGVWRESREERTYERNQTRSPARHRDT